MIPIIWFFIAWLATMGVFLLLALMTAVIALRFGLSGSKMVFICGLFLFVPLIIVGSVATYAMTSVDWSTTVNLIPSQQNSPFLFP